MSALRTLLFAGSLASILTLGCADGEDKDEETDTDTDTDTDSDTDADTDTDMEYDRYAVDATNARVRPVHLMADVLGIDIVLGAGPTPLIEDFPFPGSTPYTPFPPGTYDIHFHSTGTTDDLVFMEDVSAAAGVNYSIILHGTVAGGAVLAALGPMGMVLEDDISAPAAGMGRVRPVNLAGTTATAAGGAKLAIWNGGVKTYDLDYGEVADAAEITAGTQIWGVDYTADDVADVTFTFDVLDGDTMNLFFMPGDVLSGDPAVSVILVHHTTSTAPEEDDTYFDSNGAIQVQPVYPDTPS